MPLTQLDSKPALIVIDLQKGLAVLQTVHPLTEIIARTVLLAIAFRQCALPVVLVNVNGAAPGRTDAGPRTFSVPPDWSELVPELDAIPGHHKVTKQRWGAFHGASLDDYLQGQGVTQVVLTGVATSIGVESTARSAYDLGYNVTLVLDAMTDRDPDAHRYSTEKIFPRLGETATTRDVLKLLKEMPDAR